MGKPQGFEMFRWKPCTNWDENWRACGRCDNERRKTVRNETWQSINYHPENCHLSQCDGVREPFPFDMRPKCSKYNDAKENGVKEGIGDADKYCMPARCVICCDPNDDGERSVVEYHVGRHELFLLAKNENDNFKIVRELEPEKLVAHIDNLKNRIWDLFHVLFDCISSHLHRCSLWR